MVFYLMKWLKLGILAFQINFALRHGTSIKLASRWMNTDENVEFKPFLHICNINVIIHEIYVQGNQRAGCDDRSCQGDHGSGGYCLGGEDDQGALIGRFFDGN